MSSPDEYYRNDYYADAEQDSHEQAANNDICLNGDTCTHPLCPEHNPDNIKGYSEVK